MLWLALGSLWAVGPGGGAPAVLEKVRQSVLDSLRRLPNYTCTQTIERSYRNSPARPFGNVDRIRLEVGYIDGTEMFGWPGGERLAEADVTRLVGGTITNGEFALTLDSVFGGRNVVFGDMRDESHAGRAALQFDFTVAREGTDWTLSFGGRLTSSGYHGSFWVDRDSLGLLEIRIAAEDLPPALGYAAVTRELQFESVRIGSGEFLLPSRAELSVRETTGAEDRNESRFHDCREYRAESVIRFGSSDPGARTEAGAGSAAPAAGGAALPDEFEASLTLDAPIDSDVSAVGDPITAHLDKSIKRNREIAVPKGAIFHGRITRLDVTGGRREADLAFTWVAAGGGRVEIGGRKNEIVTVTRGDSIGWPLQSAIGIRAPGSHLLLPRGFQFFLKSAAAGR